MKTRGSIFTHKFFAYLLALYLLNYSIDGADGHPDYVAEDLTHNDIESILEFALESVLGIENAMKEHDEHDGANGSISRHHVVYCQLFSPAPELPETDIVKILHWNNKPLLSIPQNYLEITSPPPRV